MLSRSGGRIIMCSKSSFNGIIEEIPGISVDNFEKFDRSAYFVSHCHTDHTQGLGSINLIAHLEENNVNIYMSDVTAGVITGIPCYDGVKKFIKTLKLGSKTLINLPKEYGDFCFEVTLIPAGHCLGSVMFLFKTPNKTVLFTGDFRINVNDVAKLGQLHTKSGDPIAIDKMYVDTTFLDDKYDSFPKRSETVESAISIIKSWLDKDKENAVALYTSARFGYEYLFNEIYKKLSLKVYVSERDWYIYRNYTNIIPSVTNVYEDRIHKCSNRFESYPHKDCVPVTDSNNFLYVYFSAMKWNNIDIEETAFHEGNKRVDVCFSTHCSRSEVIHFVSYFSPKCVEGFPNPYIVGTINDVEKENIVFEPKRKKRKCIGKHSNTT